MSLPALIQKLEQRFRLLTFVHSLLPIALALVAQLAAFAVTARGLGVEQFGRYAVLLSIAVVAVEVVGIGSGDLLSRAVARDRSQFPVYFAMMLRRVAWTWAPVVLVCVAIAHFLLDSSLPLGWLVLCLAAETGVGRIAASIENVSVAHGHPVRAGWIRCATPMARLTVAILYFLVLDGNALTGWLMAVAIQALVWSAALIVLTARQYGRPVFPGSGADWGLGAQYAVNQTSRALQVNIDRMALSRFADEATLGAYAAGTRFLQLGSFPIQVVARMLNPAFYQEGARGLASVRVYALRVAMPAMLATGLLAAGLVSAGAWFAPVLLGPDYAESARTGMWLSLAMPFIALQYVAGDILTGSDRQARRTQVSLVATGGFGLILSAGAAWGGIAGVITAFVLAHALFALTLWVVAFRVK